MGENGGIREGGILRFNPGGDSLPRRGEERTPGIRERGSFPESGRGERVREGILEKSFVRKSIQFGGLRGAERNWMKRARLIALLVRYYLRTGGKPSGKRKETNSRNRDDQYDGSARRTRILETDSNPYRSR